jgi:GAF domain-containing protein
MNPIVLASTTILSLFVGIYILWQNPRGLIHRSFFMFIIGNVLWGGGIFLLRMTGNFFFDKVILYGGVIMWFGLVVFARYFPSGLAVKKTFWFFSLPAMIIAIILPLGLIIENTHVHADGSIEPVNGPLFPLYFGVLAFYTLLALAFFVKKYIQAKGIHKIQMRYLFAGMGLFIIAAFTFNVFLPFLEIFTLNQLGPITSLVFIVFTGYSIFRHGLLDIRIALQRSLIYGALFAVVAITYGAFIFLLSLLFHNMTNTLALVSSALTIAVGMLGAPPLERYFRKVTEKIFFKDRYDYSEALHSLSEALSTSNTLYEITENTTALLKNIFKTNQAKIYFIDDTHQESLEISDSKSFRNYRESMTIPISFVGIPIGTIFVGQKRSGDSYTDRDRTLIETFSFQAATALEKARLYQEVEMYNKTLEQKVEERTKEVISLQKEQEQMIVDISHNLQTPLTVLRLQIESMKDRETTPSLVKSIDGLSLFIYRLMNFAKANMNSGLEYSKPIDFSAIVRESIEYLEIVAQETKVTLISDIQEEIFIRETEENLRDLITNFLSNAIKYRKQSTDDTIWVRLFSDDEHITLQVKDNGIGIKEKDIPTIFDRFSRGEKYDRAVLEPVLV